MRKIIGLLLISLASICCMKKALIGQSEDAGLHIKDVRATAALADAGIFTPYLNSVPTVLSTISTINTGTITIKRFTFSSKDGANVVFGIMAYPQAAGVYPAILFNHGGGSNAEAMAGNVQAFAARGYVTLAIDQPGICGTGNTPNSAGGWKSAPAGEAPRFNMANEGRSSTLFDAVIAGLEAFNYLRGQSNVNANAIGISGTSWGGYMTTMLSGLLGNSVKAAYSSFGCGYYDAGSFWKDIIANLSPADRAAWLYTFDAGRRAPFITAPYFIEEPSNDTYFWPEAVDSTLLAIPGTRNLVCMPNLNHTSIPASGTMRQLFLDHYLKASGLPFGSINITGQANQPNGDRLITMQVSLPAGVGIAAVTLYYSVPTATWQTRNWIAIATQQLSGNTYSATIPAALVSQHVNFYAYLTDTRTVATSSIMYSTGIGPGAQPLVNGTYRIVNRNSGLALDAKDKLTANSTPIQQWTYGAGTNQQWVLTALGNGSYKIIGLQSGRSLDVTGRSTANGAAIQLYDYKASGNENQNWIITSVPGGYFTIQAVHSGKLIEVAGSGTANGALVQQWSSTNGNNQQWLFQAP